MEKVIIAGWFGSDNVGDELLLHTAIEVLTNHGARRISVLCDNPDRVSEVHKVEAIEFPSLASRRTIREHISVYRSLRSAELLILGPGTVLQENKDLLPKLGTLPLFLRLAILARLGRTPVATLGVGVRSRGSILGRYLLRCIARACVTIGVRDSFSKSLLSDRAVVIGDVATAFDYSSFVRQGQQRGDGPIFFSVRPLASSMAAVHQELVEVAIALNARGESCTFQVMARGRGAQGENDGSLFSHQFSSLMRAAESPLDMDGSFAENLNSYLSTWHKCGGAIVMRLHAAVLAVAVGVPTVAISYEQKVKGFFESLGLGDFVLTLEADASTILEKFDEARRNPVLFSEAAEKMREDGGHVDAYVAAIKHVSRVKDS